MHNKKGFTLIELLVVVLIIAILAAVALPMYKRSVAKSRVSTTIPVAKAVANAQEVYFMNENAYATDSEQLDITVPPEAAQTNATISTEENYKFVLVSHKDFPNAHYIVYQDYSPNFPGNIHCEAKTDDSVANWVCEKGLGEGTLLGNGITPEFTTYILEGSSSDGFFLPPAQTYYNQRNLNLTGNDKCVATEGSASWGKGCASSTFNDNSSCVGSAKFGCANTKFYDDSSCEGSFDGACNQGTFYSNSSCEGSAENGCYYSTFRGNSSCVGSVYRGCKTLSFYDYSSCESSAYNGCYSLAFFGNSSCVASAAYGCYLSTFKGNSYCVANVANGCSNVTYKENSYCTGEYCPAGSPKQGGGTW